MPRKTLDQQIAEVSAKKNRLLAVQRKQNRRTDTRRKVLLGAFLLHWLQNSELDEIYIYDWLRDNLSGFLKREQDKVVLEDIWSKLGKKHLTENTNYVLPGREFRNPKKLTFFDMQKCNG